MRELTIKQLDDRLKKLESLLSAAPIALGELEVKGQGTFDENLAVKGQLDTASLSVNGKDVVSAIQQTLHVHTMAVHIHSKMEPAEPGSYPAEKMNVIDARRLGIPMEATILGAWNSFDGVWSTLSTWGVSPNAPNYYVPPVELTVDREQNHLVLVPKDVPGARYNFRMFIHCLYALRS